MLKDRICFSGNFPLWGTSLLPNRSLAFTVIICSFFTCASFHVEEEICADDPQENIHGGLYYVCALRFEFSFLFICIDGWLIFLKHPTPLIVDLLGFLKSFFFVIVMQTTAHCVGVEINKTYIREKNRVKMPDYDKVIFLTIDQEMFTKWHDVNPHVSLTSGRREETNEMARPTNHCRQNSPVCQEKESPFCIFVLNYFSFLWGDCNFTACQSL